MLKVWFISSAEEHLNFVHSCWLCKAEQLWLIKSFDGKGHCPSFEPIWNCILSVFLQCHLWLHHFHVPWSGLGAWSASMAHRIYHLDQYHLLHHSISRWVYPPKFISVIHIISLSLASSGFRLSHLHMKGPVLWWYPTCTEFMFWILLRASEDGEMSACKRHIRISVFLYTSMNFQIYAILVHFCKILWFFQRFLSP